MREGTFIIDDPHDCPYRAPLLCLICGHIKGSEAYHPTAQGYRCRKADILCRPDGKKFPELCPLKEVEK